MTSRTKLGVAAALATALMGVGASTAMATPVLISFNVDYFTVTASPAGTGDFNTECCYGPIDDVTNSLVSGLPAWSGAGPLKDTVGGVGTPILWWTSGTWNGDVVTASGTGTAVNPYSNGNFFPPTGSGSNDANGLQTAIFTGTFNLAGASSVVFNLGADDDAYLYVDGNLIAGLGGVHPNDDLPTSATILSGGTHTIDLFYADRNVVAASLNFSLDSTGITPVPEPMPLALFGLGLGLLGIGLAGRRIRR